MASCEEIATQLFRKAAGVDDDSVLLRRGVGGLHVLFSSESEER